MPTRASSRGICLFPGIVAAFTLLPFPAHALQTPANCATGESSALVAKVVRHELDTASTQGRWMYTAAYTENGIQYVSRNVQTDDGIISWIVTRNGVPLSRDSRLKQIQGLISNESALARNRKAMISDAASINSLLAALPGSVQFGCAVRTGDVAQVDFQPKPGYSPWNIEQRIIAGMSGSLQLNLKEMRLTSASGAVQSDLFLFMGLGRIYRGSTISLSRAKTSTGAWETSYVSTHISGQILFLKTVAKNRDESRTDYCPVPEGLRAQDVVPYLSSSGCPTIMGGKS